MKFNPEIIRKKAAENFNTAWNDGKKLIKKPESFNQYPRLSFKYGKPHPIYDTISKLRTAYMRMGFEEMMNPLIIDEKEVHKQFGHEALTVLDRCFYLAGLPRPNVGISDERKANIFEILGDIGVEGIEKIRKVLHEYKKGDIEGDDLIFEISEKLELQDTLIIEMVDKVFPEFKDLVPISSRKILRSHMTSGWFISLSSLIDNENPPLRFFSIDRCFRREQKEDASRLMSYYSASCVIVDEDVTIDYGMAVAEGLLSQFGFEKFKFMPDKKRSKYYVPDTQTEVFAYHPKLLNSNTKYSDGWMEVATFGIYSPTALAEYNIPYPVMNLGLGVERIAMILHEADDVRGLAYPQINSEWSLKDGELAKMIYIDKTPKTEKGIEIMENIIETCEQNAQTESPCKFLAWEGDFKKGYLKVWVTEPETDTKLCGPATFNEVVVFENNILGVPRNKKWKKAFENACACTNIRFIDSFASLVAHTIEQELEDKSTVRARIIKVPSEINIKLDPIANNYITSKKKKIDLRGPVFTMVEWEFVGN